MSRFKREQPNRWVCSIQIRFKVQPNLSDNEQKIWRDVIRLQSETKLAQVQCNPSFNLFKLYFHT